MKGGNCEYVSYLLKRSVVLTHFMRYIKIRSQQA